MKHIFPLLCAFIATVFPVFARADSPPAYLTEAISLWKAIAPPADMHLFDSLHFQSITRDNAPLARYRPEQGGSVTIGQNLRQYRRDYVYLSSNQDMADRPDFGQYMTILTTLSLANESAHYKQDKNGSLADFYTFYNHGQLPEACALYSLQQYVSDVLMLESAVRIERLFLGQGSVKGLNALRIALEKNDLREEFEEFREGLTRGDINRLNMILHLIRSKREDANMGGLDFCTDKGNALLDKAIIERATAPATKALALYKAPIQPKIPPKSTSPRTFNN